MEVVLLDARDCIRLCGDISRDSIDQLLDQALGTHPLNSLASIIVRRHQSDEQIDDTRLGDAVHKLGDDVRHLLEDGDGLRHLPLHQRRRDLRAPGGHGRAHRRVGEQEAVDGADVRLVLVHRLHDLPHFGAEDVGGDVGVLHAALLGGEGALLGFLVLVGGVVLVGFLGLLGVFAAFFAFFCLRCLGLLGGVGNDFGLGVSDDVLDDLLEMLGVAAAVIIK